MSVGTGVWVGRTGEGVGVDVAMGAVVWVEVEKGEDAKTIVVGVIDPKRDKLGVEVVSLPVVAEQAATTHKPRPLITMT